MHFCLIDHVLECSPSRIIALKHVSSAEEYLQDHFPTFPVLPGVLMLECLVQAARRLAHLHLGVRNRLVLGQVRALKYGTFIPPGATLRVEVDILQRLDDGTIDCKGLGVRVSPQEQASVAVSGRFMLRPIRMG